MLPLHLSASGGDARCVEVLLEGAPNTVDARVPEEGTSAHMACEKGHVEVLRCLLTKGADIEAHVDLLDDPRSVCFDVTYIYIYIYVRKGTCGSAEVFVDQGSRHRSACRSARRP